MKTWETIGAPRGVVVLVHGMGEHHGRYEWLIEKFNSDGYHVVTGDLPGFGRTRGKRGHIDRFSEYTETIYEWFKAAASYELPVVLFGHSMGGLAVIRAVTEKYMNVAAIVLSSPCFALYEPPKRPLALMGKMMHRVTPSFTVNSGLSVNVLTRDENVRRAFLKDELRVSAVSIRWFRELERAMRMSFEDVRFVPDVPFLLMQAGEDYVVDRRAAHGFFNHLYIRDRSFKEFPDLYHELFNEPEREEVYHFMQSFLASRLNTVEAKWVAASEKT
ncbi:lysophospholipase [Salsuginibacillus halophilus]|uniref:Lysophospholipase n=1 Tax=Salsuginibacillus halophilus TaxID=517424 RepID=A0A2P8HE40_9BACI|nr:alpha/beta hydrolase [Salsuginibacillus halophilus]PSL44497.1 lysophospholipase [Salsuginibacillus halophilus]